MRSDDTVTHEPGSRNQRRPARNRNILVGLPQAAFDWLHNMVPPALEGQKGVSAAFARFRGARRLQGFVAMLLGIALVGALIPAAANAQGPYIWISRINVWDNGKATPEFVVQGRNFAPNAKGTIVAKLGDINGQKDVRTFCGHPDSRGNCASNDGYFWVAFYRFTPDHTGAASATVWIKGVRASATKDMSKPWGSTDSSSSSPSASPDAVHAASAPSSTTTTTAKPKVTTTTAKPAVAKPASTGGGTSASSPSGWTTVFSDDFNGSSLDKSKWGVYSGTGNQGIGTRSPSAISVGNGELRITGHGSVAGGMASTYEGTYGLYQVRARLDKGTGYNTATLLWPTSEHWPVDGEIDLSEIFDGASNQEGNFVHWGSNNSQDGHTQYADFTQWHTYGVDWEPDHITYYLDGNAIWTVTNGAAIPHNPHFLGIQLDVAKDGNRTDGMTFHVDWVSVSKH